MSQTKEGLPLGEGKLVEVDPNRIDAIRFTDPGWQGRFSLYKHLADTLGWYAIDSQSIKAWPASMLDRARKYPMRTVEQADGAREAEEVGAAACGLAHTSPALKILFRADASGSTRSGSHVTQLPTLVTVGCALRKGGTVIVTSSTG